MIDLCFIQNAAAEMRKDIIQLAFNTGKIGAHIAPSLSMVDIMATLFLGCMNDGDSFILSKGHGGLCYYTALYQAHRITKDQLYCFERDGGDFPGQPSRSSTNGIEFSSGSLGMGLSYGAGVALSKKLNDEKGRVFVLLGDGELNEGSVWEGAMFAAQKKLSNLVAIVDRNGMQSDGFSSDILNINIRNLWLGAGWKVAECNGHDISDITQALSIVVPNTPTAIIANTIKGKGVSFMENKREWHHAHLTDEQYRLAMAEVSR